jgi:transposase-like protein
MAERRQPSTAEFTREAVRLMMGQGYRVAAAARLWDVELLAFCS